MTPIEKLAECLVVATEGGEAAEWGNDLQVTDILVPEQCMTVWTGKKLYHVTIVERS